MLGELVYEGTGKLISMRVLDDSGTLELTFQEQGAAFGIQCTNALTYLSTPRPDGITFSEGYGVLMTVDGDTATVTSYGISIPKKNPPASSIRGASFFRTQSPYTVKDWEWK